DAYQARLALAELLDESLMTAAGMRRQLDFVDENITQLGERFGRFRGIYREVTGDTDHAQFALFASQYEQLMSSAQRLAAAFRSGDLAAARGLYQRRFVPAFDAARKAIDVLTEDAERQARARFDVSIEQATKIRNESIVFFGLIVLLMLVSGVILRRSIMRQLGGEPAHAVEVARRVASGDLGVTVDVRRGDSTSLLAYVRQMVDKLSGVVAE